MVDPIETARQAGECIYYCTAANMSAAAQARAEDKAAHLRKNFNNLKDGSRDQMRRERDIAELEALSEQHEAEWDKFDNLACGVMVAYERAGIKHPEVEAFLARNTETVGVAINPKVTIEPDASSPGQYTVSFHTIAEDSAGGGGVLTKLYGDQAVIIARALTELCRVKAIVA